MVSGKKGIEMQMSFIVMLIIAIVVFGMGIKIAMNIFTDAKEYQEELDEQTERTLLSSLNSNKIMSVGINRKEVKTGDSATFALGMINKYSKDIYYQVKIVPPILAVNGENEDISPTGDLAKIESWTFPKREVSELKDNEKIAIPLLFRVPKNAPRGLYSFTLEVRYRDIQPTGDLTDTDKLFNGQPAKIYIEVK